MNKIFLALLLFISSISFAQTSGKSSQSKENNKSGHHSVPKAKNDSLLSAMRKRQQEEHTAQVNQRNAIIKRQQEQHSAQVRQRSEMASRQRQHHPTHNKSKK